MASRLVSTMAWANLPMIVKVDHAKGLEVVKSCFVEQYLRITPHATEWHWYGVKIKQIVIYDNISMDMKKRRFSIFEAKKGMIFYELMRKRTSFLCENPR